MYIYMVGEAREDEEVFTEVRVTVEGESNISVLNHLVLRNLLSVPVVNPVKSCLFKSLNKLVKLSTHGWERVL
jgi:hypothetical protein